MPSLEAVRRLWDEQYDWRRHGEEWSDDWGGSERQWRRCFLPRLAPHLPAATILEIGCGHGRFTRRLAEHCDRLVAVDLAPGCAEACRRRVTARHVEVHVNDGRSLPMVGDRTIDLAFSFDALMDVEQDVIECYLAELARILVPGGVAFLHHSNLEHYERGLGHLRRVSPVPAGVITAMIATRGRARSVSAATVRRAATEVGLGCSSQEIVTVDGTPGAPLFDAFTMLVAARADDAFGPWWNPGFLAAPTRRRDRDQH